MPAVTEITETDDKHIGAIPPDVAQNYISTMLVELSKMAKDSGLDNLSSLLTATLAAVRIESIAGD